jgi:cytochrome P450
MELSGYLDDLVREKELRPTDDITSRLATEYVATGELEHDDLVAMVRLILVAGHETTANQISLSILLMLQQPQIVTMLLGHPEHTEPVIEELLRYWSIPQENQVRTTLRETELGAGVRACPGDGIVLAIPSANHDETVFADPTRFDPTRDNRTQLAFGHGAHYWPGAPPARLELAVALPALFRRLPRLRLAVDDIADLPFRYDTVAYGLDELPVTW